MIGRRACSCATSAPTDCRNDIRCNPSDSAGFRRRSLSTQSMRWPKRPCAWSSGTSRFARRASSWICSSRSQPRSDRPPQRFPAAGCREDPIPAEGIVTAGRSGLVQHQMSGVALGRGQVVGTSGCVHFCACRTRPFRILSSRTACRQAACPTAPGTARAAAVR